MLILKIVTHRKILPMILRRLLNIFLTGSISFETHEVRFLCLSFTQMRTYTLLVDLEKCYNLFELRQFSITILEIDDLVYLKSRVCQNYN